MSGDIHCHDTGDEGEYDHPNFQGLDEILKNQNCDDNEDDIYNQNIPITQKLNSNTFDYYTIDKFNKLYTNYNNINTSLKICHLNIRGLSKKFDNLVTYLNSLNQTFDIITLSECHITELNNIQNMYNIEGYDNFLLLAI